MYRYAIPWIFWATWASLTGWILSALHGLNGVGYGASATLAMVALVWWRRALGERLRPRQSFAQVTQFYLRGLRRRPLQALFALLCLFILIGGAIYIPWSFDATTYRLPRVLYWWAHDSWYWTNSPDNRLDYSSVGFEWQMLPVMLLTRSDRFLFLLNWIPYLFVPSLLLRLLRSFHVNRALARVLVWVIPSGYCFALQAGGIQNDGYVAFYLLSAFVFLDTYAKTLRRFDLVVSLLSAALLTGAKFSNVFLLLPYGIMLVAVLFPRRRDYPVVLAAALPCLIVSFLPLTILCYLNTGDLAGDPKNLLGNKAQHPLPTLGGNLTLIAADAMQPPLVVGFKAQLDRLALDFNATPLSQWFHRGDRNYKGIAFGEFVYEGGAGLGLGVAALVLLMAILRVPCGVGGQRPYPNVVLLLVALGAWTAFLTSLSLVASDSMARISAPYYPLLIATLPWMAGRGPLDRAWLLPAVGGLALLSSLFLVAIAPIRPVLPVIPVMRYLAEKRHVGFAQETLDKYEFWASLRDNLQDIREALPPDPSMGYLGAYRETSYGLWKPLGSRKFFELSLADPRDMDPALGLHSAIVTDRGVRQRFGLSLAEWCQRYRVETKQTFFVNARLTAKSQDNNDEWRLVSWKPDAPH